MAYSIEHVYADTYEVTHIVTHDGVKHAQYSASGELLIRHPGHLKVMAHALYTTQMNPSDLPDNHTHGGHITVQHQVPLSTRIFSPDGAEFTADHVTLADLERFRDLREASHGSWRYEVWGSGEPILASEEWGVSAGEARVTKKLRYYSRRGGSNPPPSAPLAEQA